MNNPMEMLKMLVGKKTGPEQIVQQMMGNNNNPMIANLMKMARNGENQSVEDFARNMFKEQNRDFDKEFSAFMKNFRG